MGRIEAASPKRRPRESAIIVIANVQQSSDVLGKVDRRSEVSNHVRTGSPRRRSAAGDSFHQMVGRVQWIQPMSEANLMAAKYVRTVEPASPRGKSVARNVWTTQ